MKFFTCTLLLVALATISGTGAENLRSRSLSEYTEDYDSLDYVTPDMESEDEDFYLDEDEDSYDEDFDEESLDEDSYDGDLDEDSYDEDSYDGVLDEDAYDEDSYDEDEDRITASLKATAKKVKCMQKASCRLMIQVNLCKRTRSCKRKFDAEMKKLNAFKAYYHKVKCGKKRGRASKVCYWSSVCHAKHYSDAAHVKTMCKHFVQYMHSHHFGFNPFLTG